MAKRARLLALTLLVGIFVVFGVVPASPQINYGAVINLVAPSVLWITLDVEVLDYPALLPSGSAFLTRFSDDGPLTIVTACHVVQDSPTYLIVTHKGIVDGQEKIIVGVHPEVAEGFNRAFPAVVDYCSSLYDVAILTPLVKIGTNSSGQDIYERVPLSQYMSRPSQAWFAAEKPNLGDSVFAMGYPGSTDEFNVTFGRVTSKLKQVFLRGEFTEYYPDEEKGRCVVKTRVRDDVVFNVREINLFGGVVPIKWGLDIIRKLAKPDDLVVAAENVGKPVPYSLGYWYGLIKEIRADGEILVEEVPIVDLQPFRSSITRQCVLSTLFSKRDFNKTTGLTAKLDTELEYYSVDAALRGGNSGGPAFNDRGQLVGMAIFQVSTDEGGNFFTTAENIQKAYELYAGGH